MDARKFAAFGLIGLGIGAACYAFRELLKTGEAPTLPAPEPEKVRKAEKISEEQKNSLTKPQTPVNPEAVKEEAGIKINPEPETQS